MTETAILAGGCFWGVQELLRERPGVVSTRVGYSGDPNTPNATYRRHGDHAEAVEIVFDPERISYREILEFFFQIHDPAGQRRRPQLPLRDLLHERGAEGGCPGHHRRRRRVRPLAGPREHRRRAGR